MRKNLLWMFAAILLCGAMVTSCGDDDDKNNSQSPEPEPSVAKKYDITLTFFAYKTLSAYLNYEFTYTDHNGNKSTPVTITGNEKGETLTAEEAADYKLFYSTQITESVPESKFLEYVVFHYTIKDVPADGEISWETIQHTAPEATVPTEAFSCVWPSVMYSVTTSGEKARRKMEFGKNIVSDSNLEKWFNSIIKDKEGRSIPYASGSAKAGID